jgi:hypothetical protein
MDDLKKFMSGIVPYWQTLGLELVEVEQQSICSWPTSSR